MTAPAAPAITALFDGNRIRLRWLPIVGATSYKLYVGSASGPSTGQAIAPATDADGYVRFNFSHGFENAFVRLTALNGNNEESGYSNEEAQWAVGPSVIYLTPSGVADNIAIQAAITALATSGGHIILAPGNYAMAAGCSVTANVPLMIEGYGAVLQLAAGVTGITISQGISLAKGARLEGLVVDGQSNASTIGILLKDTNNASLVNAEASNCVTGVQLDSNATGKFVEGTLIDSVLLRSNSTVGIDFTVASGTGSFMQTIIRGLKCVVGATGIGMRVNTAAVLMRSYVQGQFWIDTNQTGVTIDGDVNQSHLALTFEGAGGATGNIGLAVTANAINTTSAFWDLNWTGTVVTQLSTTRDMHYMKSSALLVQSTGTSTWGYRRHGDATDRIRFEALTAGGKITLGSGAALDATLARSAANNITSTANFQPASLKVQVKAGTPTDGDIVGTVADGQIVVDTTGVKIWVRVGGVWKGVVVA